MSEPRIVLAGIGQKLSGLTWESDKFLRIGRQTNLDVVLRDNSVERLHAEIRNQGMRWLLRDLAHNPMYPTTVNGVALGTKDQVLAADDLLQFGKLQLRVASLVNAAPDPMPARTPVTVPRPGAFRPPTGDRNIATSGVHVLVRATAQQSWDKALECATRENAVRPQQDAMLALVRANHHMTHISHLEELLRSIL